MSSGETERAILDGQSALLKGSPWSMHAESMLRHTATSLCTRIERSAYRAWRERGVPSNQGTHKCPEQGSDAFGAQG